MTLERSTNPERHAKSTAAAAPFDDRGPQADAPGRLSDSIGRSTRAAAQRAMSAQIQASPYMTAQRARLSSAFGALAQREPAVEEEELQTKPASMQAKAPEEEEPLQGKFGTESPAQITPYKVAQGTSLAGVAQRGDDGERDARTTVGSNGPLQATKGDPDDPHEVREGKYHLLKDESLGDAIIVPNVSGCAAVKVNVFSGVGMEQKLVTSIVLHSDALDESIEKAGEIGRRIVQLDMPDKSVSILVITNAKWKSMQEHSEKVLSVLTDILERQGIVFEETKKQLTYGVGDQVSIDMTGGDEDILGRYKENIPNPEQSDLRGKLVSKYTQLLVRRQQAGRSQKRIRKGRGMAENPDYIETPTRDDFILLNVEERQSAISKLEGKLDAGTGSGGWCFVTTACVRSRGLEDDCEELTLLRKFRDGYLLNLEQGPDIIAQYYRIAPAIVASINKSPDAREIYDSLYDVIRRCVDKIKQGENEETFYIYRRMIADLVQQYSPAFA